MHMNSSFRGRVEGALGRLVAFVGLVCILPGLLAIGFLLSTNSDEPVLLTDEVLTRDGTKARIHRFRTTGRGTNIFRALGRFFRSIGFDDLPALWDVVQGQISLTEFFHLNRSESTRIR
jgi:lipopolysaccharide/colanic/teichoic acid biosynthesis glycosyltransferase